MTSGVQDDASQLPRLHARLLSRVAVRGEQMQKPLFKFHSRRPIRKKGEADVEERNEM